ncbi:MAG: aminopeptidase, partial [Cytophagales bacterium]|nr:aminopeptidase [Cytophaga sp.]
MKAILLMFLVLTNAFQVYSQDLIRVKQTIKTLTSKKFHGRGAALKGDALAADYITTQFKEIGLTPVQQSYAQPFTYSINTFPGKMLLKTNEGTLTAGADYIVSPTCGAGKGTFAVYWLDTLIFSDEEKLNSFLKRNLTFVVIVYQKKYHKEFTEQTPDLLSHMYSAAAIIELQDKKLTMGLAGETYGTPVFEVLTSAFPAKAKTVSFAVENQLMQKHEAFNMIGSIEGSSKKDSFILISAHYDHLGTLGKKA